MYIYSNYRNKHIKVYEDIHQSRIPVCMSDNIYYKEAKVYVEYHFSGNPGSIRNTIYPVTHEEAETWFKDFVQNKLLVRGNVYSRYDNVVNENYPFMYHSVISPMLNIGILTPKYIIEYIQ